MEELFNLGISDNTINCMLDFNPDIRDLTKEDIIAKENILKSYGCTNNEIISIISSNALFLDRSNDEIINLLEHLKDLGFININLLLNSNPNILCLQNFEINAYINNRKINGENIENILDDLESNPYLFDEI